MLSKWCSKEGAAITLDLLIGEADYLGKGLSHIVIQEFLLSQFPNVSEVLIDPEATNSHAIHVYEKVGFHHLGRIYPIAQSPSSLHDAPGYENVSTQRFLPFGAL